MIDSSVPNGELGAAAVGVPADFDPDATAFDLTPTISALHAAHSILPDYGTRAKARSRSGP